jgi:alkaline phosphatase D
MRRIFLAWLITFSSASCLIAQVQYKRLHQDIMADLHDGKVQESLQNLEALLQQNPRDPESHYTLAVAYTLDKKLDKAMDHVLQSLKYGLPFDRYLAGPRDWLKPLVASRDFQRLMDNPNPIVHGPMLGDFTEESASVWVRTFEESPVKVMYSTSMKMEDAQTSSSVQSQAETDYTAVVNISGLEPETEYYYQIVVGEDTLRSEEWSFVTFPEKGQSFNREIGFGACAGYTPQYTHMWSMLAAHRFPVFLMLGDNVYIDHPERPAIQDYTYYRRQSENRYKSFISRTPIYAVWDDHDFGTNDSWGTSAKYEPAWKYDVWKKYRHNWNNPYYGGGEEQPGVWTDFSYGDVDFFMLDSRYYRTESEDSQPDMLGEAQMAWLKAKLRNSNATFKVIASPVPWSYDSKTGTQMTPAGRRPGGLDTWLGFQEQRKEIFDFLHDERIEGIILISGDRHRSDAWKIQREEGYDFYEFESARLTNIHTHGLMPEAIFGYNEKNSFGILHFDTTQADPVVTYKIYNIENELINQLTLKRSQLEY